MMSVDTASPFAQTEQSPESVIAQIRRQLASDPDHHASISAGVLDGIVERAVHDLWGSRVKTFVPVLAQRQARDTLLGLDASFSAPDYSVHGPTASRHVVTAFDVMSLEGDVLDLDEQDVMRV